MASEHLCCSLARALGHHVNASLPCFWFLGADCPRGGGRPLPTGVFLKYIPKDNTLLGEVLWEEGLEAKYMKEILHVSIPFLEALHKHWQTGNVYVFWA